MLDYKYIEQLLERYWECQTTLKEEAILKEFFSQDDVPAEFIQYRSLFVYEREADKMETISEDFDKRILSIIEAEKPVKARTISLSDRMRPLLRAAAIVAVVISMGTAVEKAIQAPDDSYPEIAIGNQVEKKEAVAVNDSIVNDTVHQMSNIYR